MNRGPFSVGLLAILVAGCGALPAHDSALAAAARAALEAEMTAIVQPAGSPCPADDATWAFVKTQATKRISSTYADPERTRLLGLLLRDGNRQGCALAGGVDWFSPGRQTISGSSATLEADASLWSRFRSPGQGTGTSEPHSTMHCSFVLTHTGGTWLVAGSLCDFVNGSGP